MTIHVSIHKQLQEFQLNLSLQTDASILGILGASGSGKSMLLKCIAGLVKPDSGLIHINNKLFFDSNTHVNVKPRDRKIGYVFQNYALFPHLTVQENIAFGLHHKHDDQASNLLNLISKFHLNGLESKYPSQISGGQQQRVALARALATNPDLLLLDEPFSALDEHLRKEMLKEMAQYLSLFKVKTLYVTHQMDEAYYLCDAIAVIKKGEIDAINHKASLFNKPETVESAKITGCKNFTNLIFANAQQCYCTDWHIELTFSSIYTNTDGFPQVIGIRNHHLKIVSSITEPNQFRGWIADIVRTSTQSTLYINFKQKPVDANDYHVQIDIGHDEEVHLYDEIIIAFPIGKLLLLKDS